MALFQVQWKDPETGDIITEEKEFEDSFDPHFISADFWAEDYCYGRADKGWYHIKRITS